MPSRGEQRRPFGADERGVTVQIGAVLLFGILIVALAVFQTTVVPEQNADVEFRQSLDTQRDLVDLRNAIVRSGASGDPEPQSVTLGTTYPPRTIFINPPPASGTIRTVGTQDPRVNVSLAGGVSESPHENAREFWAADAQTYNTGSLVYTPEFNEYDNAPTTVYEHSVLYNVYPGGGNRTKTGQTLVQGKRINLLTLNGSLDSRSGVGTETITPRPLSTAENTVYVRSTAGNPLYINFTSQLGAATWRDEVLASELGDAGYVESVSSNGTVTVDGITFHRISVELQTGVTYQLSGASVAVGVVSVDAAQPVPTYFVVTDGFETVGNGSVGRYVVEVRDQFNNPIGGATVNATADGDHFQWCTNEDCTTTANATSVEADGTGTATLNYTAVNVTTGDQTGWLNVSMNGGDRAYEYTNASGLEVPVLSFGGDGDGGNGGETNPGSPGDVILTGAQIQQQDYVVLTFNNSRDAAVNLTYARIGFYYKDGTKEFDTAAIANVSSAAAFPASDPAAVMEIGGSYAELDPAASLSTGENQVTLEFRQSGGGGNAKVRDSDYFILTVVWEVDGDSYRVRYFVNPDA